MSAIAFMKQFPWGEPTDFKKKIWAGLNEGEEIMTNGMGESVTLPKENWGIPCGTLPKIHTIRSSSRNTKNVDSFSTLYHWADKPYKSPWERFALVTIKGYQRIGIQVMPDGGIGMNIIESGKARQLELLECATIIKNDGLNPEQFRKYFGEHLKFKEFHGYIYHWTDLKY